MKIKLCSLVSVKTIILMRMRHSDVKMDMEEREERRQAERALLMMFAHARTGRADLTGQPQQRKPLVRPRFKEGWVSEGGSDFSSKSRLNPDLSGNIAECKVGAL